MDRPTNIDSLFWLSCSQGNGYISIRSTNYLIHIGAKL